jgi:hypothetical protein
MMCRLEAKPGIHTCLIRVIEDYAWECIESALDDSGENSNGERRSAV